MCGREISCLARRARSLKGGSSVIECASGICALVNSSYITVNLIKYIVIPIEGILISWVRNKLFSLLLQMKTSLLFCRGRHVLGRLACPMESSSVWSLTRFCCLALGRFPGWDSGGRGSASPIPGEGDRTWAAEVGTLMAGELLDGVQGPDRNQSLLQALGPCCLPAGQNKK